MDALHMLKRDCKELYYYLMVRIGVTAFSNMVNVMLINCWSARFYIFNIVLGVLLFAFLWIYTIVASTYFYSDEFQMKLALQPNTYFIYSLFLQAIFWMMFIFGSCFMCIMACAFCALYAIYQGATTQQGDAYQR